MKRILFALLSLILLLNVAKADTKIPAPELVQLLKVDEREVLLTQFFEKRNCPLTPYAHEFIQAADKYSIDYKLLPAISVIESQCGKRYPRSTNNPFGWASAGTGFKSIPHAIDFITGQLATGKYYANKTIEKKLATYCPNPTYPSRVIKLMNEIK